MKDPYKYPKLRWPIDISLEKIVDEEVLILRCPSGVSPKPLCLMPAVGPILSCFTGDLSVEEITEKFSTYGISVDLIHELIVLCEQNLFLESPNYFAAEKKIREDFEKSTLRPATMAGGGYAADAERLGNEIDRYVAQANGSAQASNKKMRGLIAPHIDYRRGHDCYGITYSSLKSQGHDLYILLGTAHQQSKGLFHLTLKDFDSPLGRMRCDRDFVDKLARLFGEERSFSEELLHKSEHSLELQVPFLKRLQPEQKIVPILVGSFYKILLSGKAPGEVPEYKDFLESLSACITERLNQDQSVCLIAGVDLAHVGRDFGDDLELSPELMEEVESKDRVFIDAILNQNKKDLIAHISSDSDARHICGYPTIYTLIDIFDRLDIDYAADLFDYSQSVDYEKQCAVTFAGIGFYSDN